MPQPDPYNIYTYLLPYLSEEGVLHDPEEWYSKFGMYLTPFDSRTVDRIGQVANYDVKDLYNEALANTTKVDVGIGKMGFQGGYALETKNRLEGKVADAMQLTLLKAYQRQADLETAYSSGLYTELGRLADLGAFDLDELARGGVAGVGVPAASESMFTRAGNYQYDPYQAMLRKYQKGPETSAVNLQSWDETLTEKCPCPEGGYSRICCGTGEFEQMTAGYEPDVYAGQGQLTGETLEDIAAYDSAIGSETYTGLSYSADLENCVATGASSEMCQGIVNTMSYGFDAGYLGLGSFQDPAGYEGDYGGQLDQYGNWLPGQGETTTRYMGGDYDLLYGAFGESNRAQEVVDDIQSCMEGAGGDYQTMANCMVSGQEMYSTERGRWVSDEMSHEFVQMGQQEQRDTMCFSRSHSEFNPHRGDCATWAQYKGMSSENFYNQYVKSWSKNQMSYEEWLSSVGGSWGSIWEPSRYGIGDLS